MRPGIAAELTCLGFERQLFSVFNYGHVYRLRRCVRNRIDNSANPMQRAVFQFVQYCQFVPDEIIDQLFLPVHRDENGFFIRNNVFPLVFNLIGVKARLGHQCQDFACFYFCYDNGAFVIPDGVRKIAAYAFEDCYYLRQVEMPSTMETISEKAFEDCYHLRGNRMAFL